MTSEEKTTPNEEEKVLSASYVMGRHVLVNDDKDNGTTTSSSNAIRFDWPGVRVIFPTVKGTSSLKIRMKAGQSVFGYCITINNEVVNKNNDIPLVVEDDAIIVDDNDSSTTTIVGTINCTGNFSSPLKDYPIGNNDTSVSLDPLKAYTVAIWKRDDPGNGICEMVGLVVDQSATIIESSSQRKTCILECVGDSDTVGFGNLGNRSSMLYALFCQMPMFYCCENLQLGTDANQSWPGYVCQSLKEQQQKEEENNNNNDDNKDIFDYQYHIVAWSGIGAKYSYTDNTMIDIFPRVFASDGKSASNVGNYKLDPVDAVLIYIGQNDMSNLNDSCNYSDDKLSKALEELILKIRIHRPYPIPIILLSPTIDTIVACTSTMSECKKVAETHHQVQHKLIYDKLGGNDKGYYFVECKHDPQISLSSHDDFGSMMHWSKSSCQKWATSVVTGITPILSSTLNNNNDNNE